MAGKSRKRTSRRNPEVYAYQVQYSTPAGFKRLGAFPATSRTRALAMARKELQDKGLWTPRTRLITGAVPLTSSAAKHRNAKNPRADVKRIVRDQIRLGHSYVEAIKYFKAAGLSGKLLEQAKKAYTAEAIAERPVARRPPAKGRTKRITEKQVQGLKSKAKAAYGSGVKLNPSGRKVLKTAKKLGRKALGLAGGGLVSLGKAMSNPKRTRRANTGAFESLLRQIADRNPPPREYIIKFTAGTISVGDHTPAQAQRELVKAGMSRKSAGAVVRKAQTLNDRLQRGISTPEERAKRKRKGAKKYAKYHRNDGAAERREDFAGSMSGYKDLYFPEGTPGGLSTLGPLVSIVTESGTIKPVKGGAYLCQAGNGRLYIGSTKDMPLWNGPAQSFGLVKRVEYRCAKPHLGEPDTVTWYHDFESPLPELRADGKGGLRFHGGGYTIKREGIVG